MCASITTYTNLVHKLQQEEINFGYKQSACACERETKSQYITGISSFSA